VSGCSSGGGCCCGSGSCRGAVGSIGGFAVGVGPIGGFAADVGGSSCVWCGHHFVVVVAAAFIGDRLSLRWLSMMAVGDVAGLVESGSCRW